jgi:hypothetical protein
MCGYMYVYIHNIWMHTCFHTYAHVCMNKFRKPSSKEHQHARYVSALRFRKKNTRKWPMIYKCTYIHTHSKPPSKESKTSNHQQEKALRIQQKNTRKWPMIKCTYTPTHLHTYTHTHSKPPSKESKTSNHQQASDADALKSKAEAYISRKPQEWKRTDFTVSVVCMCAAQCVCMKAQTNWMV